MNVKFENTFKKAMIIALRTFSSKRFKRNVKLLNLTIER